MGSEAQLDGTSEAVKACKIGTLLGDPENPPCARLIVSGNYVVVDENSTEGIMAKKSLFESHPAFAQYPTDHSFFVGKIEIDEILLLDHYGGPGIIDAADYLAGSTQQLLV